MKPLHGLGRAVKSEFCYMYIIRRNGNDRPFINVVQMNFQPLKFYMGHLIDRGIINASVAGDGYPQRHILTILTEYRIVTSFHFVGLLPPFVNILGCDIGKYNAAAKRRLSSIFRSLSFIIVVSSIEILAFLELFNGR